MESFAISIMLSRLLANYTLQMVLMKLQKVSTLCMWLLMLIIDWICGWARQSSMGT